MKYFGPHLTAWRLAHGMTQEGLACRAGLSRPNLSAIEKGHRDLTLGTLSRLAKSLDVPLGILLDESPAATLSDYNRFHVDTFARCIIDGTRVFDPRTNQMLDDLACLIKNKLNAYQCTGFKRVKRKKNTNYYYKIIVDKLYGKDLVERILKRTEKYF